MRSELIFKAMAYEPNRYQLCRVVARGTRKLHRPNTRLQETVNEFLDHSPQYIPKSEVRMLAHPRTMEREQRRAA